MPEIGWCSYAETNQINFSALLFFPQNIFQRMQPKRAFKTELSARQNEKSWKGGGTCHVKTIAYNLIKMRKRYWISNLFNIQDLILLKCFFV